MSSLSFLALLLASTVTTSPLLETREFRCRQTQLDLNRLVHYAPDWPTCANELYLKEAFGNGSPVPDVTVQPDCDDAIAAACSAVDRMFTVGRNLYPVKAQAGSCEVNIIFSQRQTFEYPDYATTLAKTCTTSLQSITETCMLIGVGKYAAKGQQAGLRNVLYDGVAHQRDTPTPRFRANTECNHEPGYFVGSTGYFVDSNGLISPNTYGRVDIGGVHAEKITEECLMAENC